MALRIRPDAFIVFRFELAEELEKEPLEAQIYIARLLY